MHDEIDHLPSSYRDPSGFVFKKHGIIYRRINQSYKKNFELLHTSGLYEKLVQQRLLVAHEVVANADAANEDEQTIKPEQLHFISYPFEWTFEMLKDAALLTLKIAKLSLSHGMILKDATPYNVQWKDGRFIFIDTLSFEQFNNTPWIAYRQFCESFLGPLLIMHYTKKQMPGLCLAWPEGIPIDTIRSLLPGRSKFSLHTYLHIHLHAKYARKKAAGNKETSLTSQKLNNLLTSLEILINKLNVPSENSAWSGYYEEAAERDDYLEAKKVIITRWIDQQAEITTAIDIGANEGEFARLLAARKIKTIAADFDVYCIAQLYDRIKSEKLTNIIPITVDISQPGPAIGVNNLERPSLLERTKVDLLLALAVVHHLAIGKNIPFNMIFETLSQMCDQMIIEFVPKDDEKVKLMLSGKKDIYTNYSQSNFELALKDKFTILTEQQIGNSGRRLYLVRKHRT